MIRSRTLGIYDSVCYGPCMWDQISQLDGKLQLKAIQPPATLGVERPWVWLSVEGGGETPIKGTEVAYPESERRRTFTLEGALEHLRKGRAMRCVGGPVGYINLGDSFYTPEGAQPWYRWHGETWRQAESVSSSDLIGRISVWPEDSRWVRVDRPTSP
jgi:hypothetical protein